MNRKLLDSPHAYMTRLPGKVDDTAYLELYERWCRETVILAIWEGTAHRQILDGLDVIQRKNAHEQLFEHLGKSAQSAEVERLRKRIVTLMGVEHEQPEAQSEALFRELAEFTATSLLHRTAVERVQSP
ncbi:MAG: hypothetical protein P8166_12755 [Candidatus Thiodiazotropha sp.]